MKLKKTNIVFFTTIGISIIVFSYLTYSGYRELKTLKDILKIIFSILFPIPLLFSTRFLFIENFKVRNTNAYIQQNQKSALIMFLMSSALVLFVFQLIDVKITQAFDSNLIVAYLINSAAIAGYVFNYLFYNNLKVNGVLSGILFSLAIQVFFLSN